MSNDFKLLNEINTISKNGIDKTEKISIKYQEYELLVEFKQHTVLIPLRECEFFEKTLEEYATINKVQLKKILHKHRGIRK